MCMQTGTHPHSFKISQISKTQEIRWVKPPCAMYTCQVTGECVFSQMKQAAAHLCCSQTLTWSSQTHFPVHVPYAPFPKTIQQLPEWQSSNLQQFKGGQSDGPVTGRVGGDRIQTQWRREGGMIARRRGKAKESVAFRLGVGSDGEAAVHTETRLCEKVWVRFH